MTAEQGIANKVIAPALLAEAVARLRAGELVAFPTETVYGLGADASNPAAVRKIYALKGRPATHPVIVHLPNANHLARWAAEVPPAAALLAKKFWPGPLTLVLRKADRVDSSVTGGQDSVGLRVPAHPLAQELLAAFDSGIAAPSANRYGHVSPTTAAHVLAEFGRDAPLILDGGACQVGIESTIVDARGPVLRILRPGMLGVAQIAQAVAGLPGVRVVGRDTPTGDSANSTSPRVPGSTAAHYAPTIPLRVQTLERLLPAVRSTLHEGQTVAVIALGTAPDDVATPVAAARCHWRALGVDAEHYAHELYAALHELEWSGAHAIWVEQPPDTPEWQAIRDRLERAAHGAAR